MENEQQDGRTATNPERERPADAAARPAHDASNAPAAGTSQRTSLEVLSDRLESVRREIAKVIVGQASMIDQLIAALLVDGHVLIEGVPGVAKTLAARLLAQTLDVEFARIQFTPDLMPSDVIGTNVFNPRESRFEFHRGPIFANVVLIDEINRAPAKTQAALFEAMEERQATVDGTTYAFAPPFTVLATQNPVEHEGTYRLPEAQLDRFMFKIEVGYPDLAEETRILTAGHERRGRPQTAEVRPVLSGADLLALRETVHQVHVDAKLMEYVAKLVQQTRSSPSIFLGGSPRASLAILAASKAFAVMSARDFVIPEDIQLAAFPVLRHRLILTPEREMEGTRPDDVIKELIKRVEVPR